MKNYLLLFAFVVSLCVGVQSSYGDELDLDKYKEFLETNKDADYNAIKALHKQNSYLYYSKPQYSLDDAENLEVIKSKFALTEDELALLKKNNFVVLGKSKYNSFTTAINDYWNQDIPLYFTSDALMFAFHKSYDELLKTLEEEIFISKLDDLLSSLQYLTPPQNASDNELIAYKDAKLYVFIALSLLTGQDQYNESDPVYIEHSQNLLSNIQDESFADISIFPGTEQRMYDFSQLTPRGHYTETPELQQYFKAMMWLGRTELYLTKPNADMDVPIEALNRQTAVAYLIASKIYGINEQLNNYRTINTVINSFVGEQDNVQINHIMDLASEIGVTNLGELFTGNKFEEFRAALVAKPYADQKILSQCLIKDCSNTDNIKPASAFMIYGNRFILDSYVFSNLVYDKVNMRMMPKPMDVLFVLGNNSASEFLQADFSYGNYGKNIAGLRYLVDSYGDEFWNSSVYNKWLYSIKTMNPPASIDKLPVYMQSPAWWQMKMNTQLASWATIRHDNLLYAKQSYSGIPTCGFPNVMVEPVPEFYAAISGLCKNLKTVVEDMQYPSLQGISTRLNSFIFASDKLETIAKEELNGQAISDSNLLFLKQCFSIITGGCTAEYNGWYSELFSGQDLFENDAIEHLVADVHTQPADEGGSIVGKVLHVGTGAVNTMIVITPDATGKSQAFAGPVYSYYEYITEDFERLTDSEWQDMFSNNQQLARPSFTKLYLADENGAQYDNPDVLTYTVGVDDEHQFTASAEIGISPNPFIYDATIWIRINNLSALSNFSVEIFDQSGKLVKSLLNETISGGNYAIKWDGKNRNGESASTGVYLAKVNINGSIYTAKIVKQ